MSSEPLVSFEKADDHVSVGRTTVADLEREARRWERLFRALRWYHRARGRQVAEPEREKVAA